jgi:4-amino-4-deoxy-L-arabinose transferase-like glycosyltransferase
MTGDHALSVNGCDTNPGSPFRSYRTPYQLATGQPVMPIGGFNGSDPSPTLARFQQYVTEQKIHYFIGDRDGGMRGNAGSQISAWVTATFPATTVGGVTVYDLTTSPGATS